MVRSGHILSVVTALGLMTLSACSGQQQATAPQPTEAAVTATTTTAAPGDYAVLSAVVAKTKAAIEAEDAVKAKEEFERFEDGWKAVEDGIKKKSPKGYDSIEASLNQLNNLFKTANPKKEAVLAALQAMTQSIAALPKS